jgi:glycosyltransferase involved in cell wall biosynthesis
MNKKLYIVMPAYNEAENIEDIVKQLYSIVEKIGNESRLVVFDDGSKDDTYDRMKMLAKKYPLFIAETKANSGHGATCLHVYRYALANGADYIFQTDSDGQTCPDEFWGLWEQREKYPLLIGSRTHREDGFSRTIVTKMLRIIIAIMFKIWIKDANTPFRLMKKEFLASALQIIPDNFFLSNIAITTIAAKQKQKIFWMPITFKPRQNGISSVNWKNIFKIGVRALSDFRTINKRLHNARLS